MKKILSFLAAAAMLFTASCSNDDFDAGDEAVVSFSMNLNGGSSTKSDHIIGKGTLVNKLAYSVFEVKKNDAGEVQSVNFLFNDETAVQEWPVILDIRLAKKKDYKVVFWAQNNSCGAYSLDPATMNVTVSYDGYNNDEARDAFYKAIDLSVTGSEKVDVELKRPFAQLNVGVTAADWNAAVISNAEVTQSEVTISKVANGINLMNGQVTAANESVTFQMANIPVEMLMVETDPQNEGKEAYYYLSMSYLLVNDQNTEDGSGPADVSVDFLFQTVSNQIDLNVPVVPVQRNHRTNILGQILTGNVTFEIKIDAEFDGNHNIPVTPKEDIVLYDTYAEVYNIEGLMKWCYIVNNEEGKLGYVMVLS